MTSPNLTATVLPEFAAVRLVLTDAPAGPLELLREDVNGTTAVRQLPGQETSAGSLVLVDYEPAIQGTVTYSVEGTRTNVIPNPSAEVNTANWSSGGGRLTLTSYEQLSEVSPSGTHVLRCTANVAMGSSSGYVYPSGAAAAATPGDLWSGVVWVRPSLATTMKLQIRGLDSGGVNYVSPYIESPSVSCPANVWTKLQASGPVPAGAASVLPLVFWMPSMALGDRFDLDAVQLVEEPEPGPYIEGTQPTTVSVTVNAPLTPEPRISVVGRPANVVAVQAVETYSETSESGTRLVTIYAGGELPIVQGLDRRQGSVGLHVPSYAIARQLRQLLSSGAVAQLRQPTYQGLDLYLTPDRVRIDPVPQDNAPAEWLVTVDYSEADPAELADVDLASGAAWTVADVAATFATCADVLAAFPSCLDLAVGP